MLVNMRETWNVLDKASKVTIKPCKKKNLTFTVHKTMSVRNYVKMMEK